MHQIRDGRRQALIPEAVWAACFFILTETYAVSRRETVETLLALSAYKRLIGDHVPAVRASLEALLSHNIALVDAIVLVTAQTGWGLVSFDPQLMKLFSQSS
jgi:hypothetical protein